ncbi:hypothetical protein BurJ1DRAFT_1495 [Burkholderiales bacterium JOSHI_001]|nr:hypothetical protein BurJ1DRAFT_1495 [Burkholderiales bacterium JOSHI_001]
MLRTAPVPVPAPVPTTRRWIARALAPAATAWLVACGGGGGDSSSPADQVAGPPTVAATLSASTTDASRSAQSAVASADAAATRARSLSGLAALVGAPIGSAPVQLAGLHTRAQIQAVTTSACTDFFDLPCSGSIVLDTNVADNATTVRPNDYVDVRFQSAGGLLLGSQVSLNGRLRVDFLSTLNLNATTFPGMDVLLTLDAFGGAVNGAAFGPISDIGRLQISSSGVSTMTAGGASYQGLSGVTTSGASSYTIGSGTVRTGHWTDSNTYVDVALAGWQVVNGRPAPGSQATLTAAQGSINVIVATSTAQTVTYTVSITVNGVASHYLVTATYGGGATPAYSAVPT